MIVAVAERLHNPLLTRCEVAAWDAFWRFHPLAAMLGTPALPEGPSRARLQNLFGFSFRRPTQLVNLLYPDPEPGSWDEELAREAAYRLLTYALVGGHRLALLGRRVTDAFRAAGDVSEPVQLNGTPLRIGYVDCLALPHPSGRSRLANDPDHRERCRRALELFASEVPA